MSDMEPSPLFRKEALQKQNASSLGKVVVASPLSHSLMAGFGVLVAVALSGFLVFGEYTRKARIVGWLAPEEGLVRVAATQPGVVAEVLAAEGQAVAAGQPLLQLSLERQSAKVGGTQAEMVRLIQARRESLRLEGERQGEQARLQAGHLRQRVEAVGNELRQIDEEIRLQAERVSLGEAALNRWREAKEGGLVSGQQLDEVRGQLVEHRYRLQTLRRMHGERQRERIALQAELEEAPLRARSQAASLERDMAALEQELAETEARRSAVLTAPEAGVVTALLTERGSSTSAGQPLLTIVPAGARLSAHLLGLNRAVGFLRAGQRVMLRYQAFPYQKFGHHGGTVMQVSRSPVSPAELPPSLVGNLPGAEPAYRVLVRLDGQTVNAYGRAQPLQAGMQVEADVMLERRRLYEWVLEPILSLTGRL